MSWSIVSVGRSQIRARRFPHAVPHHRAGRRALPPGSTLPSGPSHGSGKLSRLSAWLEAEVAVVGPAVIVCLGATAAQSLLGPSFRVTVDHGRLMPSAMAPFVLATLHPAAVLRMPSGADRERALHQMVDDLKSVPGLLAKKS